MFELYKNLPVSTLFSNVNLRFSYDKVDHVTIAMRDLMIDDGFDKDDFDSTLARFASKGQKFVHDVSKLKRKAPEPMALSSATNVCGAALLTGIADILTASPERQKQDEEWRKRKQKQREDWESQDRQWNENR